MSSATTYRSDCHQREEYRKRPENLGEDSDVEAPLSTTGPPPLLMADKGLSQLSIRCIRKPTFTTAKRCYLMLHLRQIQYSFPPQPLLFSVLVSLNTSGSI